MPTKIAWTGETWNPITGCSKVSPGCIHCYAERLSLRYGWSKLPWTPANAAINVVLHMDRVTQPMRWKKPRLVFTCSMADLFHEEIPESFLDMVFAVMAATPRHTYQVLTKRAGRMQTYLSDADLGRRLANRITLSLALSGTASDAGQMGGWRAAGDVPMPRPNIWLGVSTENQRWADARLPFLSRTPAVERFVSCEPLLGPLDLAPWLPCLGLVIVGGESGPEARPMDVAWARSLQRQCRAAGVPFFMKQDSGQWPGRQGKLPDDLWAVKEMPPLGWGGKGLMP